MLRSAVDLPTPPLRSAAVAALTGLLVACLPAELVDDSSHWTVTRVHIDALGAVTVTEVDAPPEAALRVPTQLALAADGDLLAVRGASGDRAPAPSGEVEAAYLIDVQAAGGVVEVTRVDARGAVLWTRHHDLSDPRWAAAPSASTPTLGSLTAGLHAGESGGTAEVITNGGLESGDLSGWTLTENRGAASVVQGEAHSGDHAAELRLVNRCGHVSMSQRVIVPSDALLSLAYRIGKSMPEVTFGVQIRDYSNMMTYYFWGPWDDPYVEPDSFSLLGQNGLTAGGWETRSWPLGYLAGHDVDVSIAISAGGLCANVVDVPIFIDDVSLAPGGPQTEPIANGSFEGGLDGWFASATARASVELDGAARSGSHAARLEVPFRCDHAWLRQRFIVPEDGVLGFSYRVPSSSPAHLRVSLRDFTETDPDSGEPTEVRVLDVDAVATDGWIDVEYDLGALVGHYVSLEMFLGVGGTCAHAIDAAVLIDDVFVTGGEEEEEAPDATPPASGQGAAQSNPNSAHHTGIPANPSAGAKANGNAAFNR